MIAALYPSKKAMKAAIGQPLRFQETALLSPEYPANGSGKLVFVGPGAYDRRFYGTVTLENGLIKSVK